MDLGKRRDETRVVTIPKRVVVKPDRKVEQPIPAPDIFQPQPIPVELPVSVPVEPLKR